MATLLCLEGTLVSTAMLAKILANLFKPIFRFIKLKKLVLCFFQKVPSTSTTSFDFVSSQPVNRFETPFRQATLGQHNYDINQRQDNYNSHGGMTNHQELSNSMGNMLFPLFYVTSLTLPRKASNFNQI